MPQSHAVRHANGHGLHRRFNDETEASHGWEAAEGELATKAFRMYFSNVPGVRYALDSYTLAAAVVLDPLTEDSTGIDITVPLGGMYEPLMSNGNVMTSPGTYEFKDGPLPVPAGAFAYVTTRRSGFVFASALQVSCRAEVGAHH